MPEKRKAAIIVGLQGEDREFGLVEALGYSVLLITSSISLNQALTSDFPVEVDLNNAELVVETALRLSEQYDIQAVFTINEYRVPLAARVREALGVPHGLPYEAALNCRNKKRTRQLLAQRQVGSAKFTLVRSPDEAREALAEFGLPVIIKPSNEAGSNLVARCDTPDAVRAAVEAIQASGRNWVGHTLDPDILLEEFLDGPEFSVESCTAGGETTVLAVTAKLTTPPPFAAEVGHTVPAPLPPHDVAAITELVKDALRALGVNDTVTHTEVKLTPAGPRIIEVNARPGGDRIPVLVRAVTGYDLHELSLHLALGGNLIDAPRHPILAPSAAIRFLTAPADGIVTFAEPSDIASLPDVVEVEIRVHSGDSVRMTTNNYNRLGHVIVRGSAERQADLVANEVISRLELQVDNLLHTS